MGRGERGRYELEKNKILWEIVESILKIKSCLLFFSSGESYFRQGLEGIKNQILPILYESGSDTSIISRLESYLQLGVQKTSDIESSKWFLGREEPGSKENIMEEDKMREGIAEKENVETRQESSSDG